MRRYNVAVTASASRDIDNIVDYVDRHDGRAKAEYVLGRISAVIEGLSNSPESGPYPPELSGLGIREYRQAFFKPYRVIYSVSGNTVYVNLIADGRRDMQSLLARRLFS